MEEGLVS